MEYNNLDLILHLSYCVKDKIQFGFAEKLIYYQREIWLWPNHVVQQFVGSLCLYRLLAILISKFYKFIE